MTWQVCGEAYNVIRTSGQEFINLFQLMLSTGIPELTAAEDINWLRECLLFGADTAYATEHFTIKIDVALRTRSTERARSNRHPPTQVARAH
jgi:hypothetical protein